MSIDIPEQIMTALKRRACDAHRTVQDIALEAIQRDLEALNQHRITLPLKYSQTPGTLLSMTNAEIEEILED